ncbi:MAG: hypothetical protein IT176_01650 [Acidobacteria bacterium]|nr:hypothetical protein [Acidobacteriota bacterium]
MRSVFRPPWAVLACTLLLGVASARGQPAPQAPQAPAASPAVPVPDHERLRVSFELMGAGYWDYSQAPLGHEAQGRIGWAIVGLRGTINPYISYAAELNPVDDAAYPEPACGEAGYFYPNVPDPTIPAVACVPDGRNRVDLYRFVGLDPLTQQNAVRSAVIDVHRPDGRFGVRAGRFVLPLGFGWREMGSWSNVDAPLIQRLDANATFGAGVYGRVTRAGATVARIELGLVRGDTNRNTEYSYSAFVAADEDTNSGATGFGRVVFTPSPLVDLRISGKYGYSGSKVEPYPSFYISKRNDKALIGSIQLRPSRYVRAFGEYARYVSGLPDTSAELIGLPPSAVIKRGYYAGVELAVPLGRRWEARAGVTREDLSRNDSLVWFLEQQALYRAHLGARVRSTIVRWSIRPAPQVELGAFWNKMDNPLLWLSGVVPVEGDRAYQTRGEDRAKYGMVFTVSVP